MKGDMLTVSDTMKALQQMDVAEETRAKYIRIKDMLAEIKRLQNKLDSLKEALKVECETPVESVDIEQLLNRA